MAALAPHEASRKVFILDDADRMTLPTAQALLKTLEEPPPRTHLVLIIANPRALPPTLLSRCQRVRFGPLPTEDAARLLEARGVPPEASQLLARLAQGRPGLALGLDLDAVRSPAGRGARARGRAAGAARRGPRPGADRSRHGGGLPRALLGLVPGRPLPRGRRLPGAPRQRRSGIRAPRPCRRGCRRRSLAAALARVKAAWVALESNVNPRLALETALLGLGGVGGVGGGRYARRAGRARGRRRAAAADRRAPPRERRGPTTTSSRASSSTWAITAWSRCRAATRSARSAVPPGTCPPSSATAPTRACCASRPPRRWPRGSGGASASWPRCGRASSGPRAAGFPLKVVDVEMTPDGRRVTVLFAAETRIDFRELVRDLAREFRARIEMRQVGARDVTKVQDGIGPCGRSALLLDAPPRLRAGLGEDGQDPGRAAERQPAPRQLRPAQVLPPLRVLAVRGAARPAAARRLRLPGRVRRRRAAWRGASGP